MSRKQFKIRLKSALFLMVLVFFRYGGHAEKIAELSGVMKPHFITIGGGKLFVIDGPDKIHIYLLEKGRAGFLKTFGKKGQGPGEFLNLSHLKIAGEYLEIPTMGKYSRFSLAGEFIDEVKLTVFVEKNAVFRVGKNFLARHVRFDDKILTTKIVLYGPDFKVVKELGHSTADFGKRRLNIAAQLCSTGMAGDKIYIVESGKETRVKFFDPTGKFLDEIGLPLEPVNIDPVLEKKLEEEFKGNMSEERWKFLKKIIYCPPAAPGLNYFHVWDNKMAARTYRFKGDKAEFVFFDMKGKELKRMYLYDTGRTSGGILFCFYKDSYYYVKDNADTGNWELFSVKVF